MSDSARDLYDVLGVPRTASQTEVTEAFRSLVRELHPDGGGDSGTPRLDEVVKAYRVLRNPERRAAYDRQSMQRERCTEGPTQVPVNVRGSHYQAQSSDIRVGPVQWWRHGR